MRVMTNKNINDMVSILSQMGLMLMDSKDAMNPDVNQELSASVMDLLVKVGGDKAVGKHYWNMTRHKVRKVRCTGKQF